MPDSAGGDPGSAAGAGVRCPEGLLVLNSPPGALTPPGGLYLRLLDPHGLGEKLSFH